MSTALSAAVLSIAALLAGTPATAADGTGNCPPGEFCLWRQSGYGGEPGRHDLTVTDIESCVATAEGMSFVNRTGRPVTTYQSAECATEAEFMTYPSGTWVPESPYTVRAFKIWEN